MRLKQQPARNREPDLTGLINVIFLILIFFMIAGTLRPFAARDLKLARTTEATATTPGPGRLIAHADGRITYRGIDISLDRGPLMAAISNDATLDKAARFTLIADARLDAAKALAIVSALQAVGVTDVAILTERQSR